MFRLLSVPVFFLTAAIFAYCFVKVLQSYMKKRKGTAISLLLLFAGCVFISTCSALDGFLYGTVYAYRYGYALSLLANATATVGLLYFATDIFSSGETKKTIQLIRFVYSAIFTAICIWGTIDLLLLLGGGTSLPLTFLFMLNMTLYIVLAVKAYGLAKRISEEKFKTAIAYIGHYALANIGIYVFFILDSVIAGIGQEGTTVWGFIGACIFALTGFLAYIGFVKPMNEK